VEGFGQRQLVAELVKKWKGRHWNTSYLASVLNNRAVLGELQPKRIDPETGKRKPDGKVIPGYYPRISDDELWYQAQNSKAKRKKIKGRSTGWTQLFPGLIFNAKDGSRMHLQTTSDRRAKTFQRRLVSYKHLCG